MKLPTTEQSYWRRHLSATARRAHRIEHPVGPATTRPAGRGSTGLHALGIFAGRGWRTARQPDGSYTLTAADGVLIPLCYPAAGLVLAAGFIAYRHTRRRRVGGGIDVVAPTRT